MAIHFTAKCAACILLMPIHAIQLPIFRRNVRTSGHLSVDCIQYWNATRLPTQCAQQCTINRVRYYAHINILYITNRTDITVCGHCKENQETMTHAWRFTTKLLKVEFWWVVIEAPLKLIWVPDTQHVREGLINLHHWLTFHTSRYSWAWKPHQAIVTASKVVAISILLMTVCKTTCLTWCLGVHRCPISAHNIVYKQNGLCVSYILLDTQFMSAKANTGVQCEVYKTMLRVWHPRKWLEKFKLFFGWSDSKI